MALTLQQSDIQHFRKKKTFSGFRGFFSWAMEKDAIHTKTAAILYYCKLMRSYLTLSLDLHVSFRKSVNPLRCKKNYTHKHTILICFLALSLSFYLLSCWSFVHLLISIQFWWKQSCLFSDYKVPLCHYSLKTSKLWL